MFKKLLIATLIGSASFSAMASLEVGETLCIKLAAQGMYDDGSIAGCLYMAREEKQPGAQWALGAMYAKKALNSLNNGLGKDGYKYLNEALKWTKKAANQKKNPEIASEAKKMLPQIEKLKNEFPQ